MDNHRENIKQGWNYPEAKEVAVLGLSPIQTQVLHASCKFGKLTIYKKTTHGLVSAIRLQGVKCNREQVIQAIHELVALKFIHLSTISRDRMESDKYEVYYVKADFLKIRKEWHRITGKSSLFPLF